MFISEIFYSIQGEGELTGMPSIFIRTAGCNLRCAWCDTPYASWRPEGRHMSLDGIMSSISRFPCKYVVLTGGEPMIAKDIAELAVLLRQKQYHITIETAATIHPKGIVCNLASLSPKLSNSNPGKNSGWQDKHEQTRYRPDIIRAWIEYPYQLKFVISSPEDVVEMQKMVADVGNVPLDRIFLMPEGINSTTIQERGGWLAEICKKYGYRYTHRLHIELWGNQKGV